MRYRLVILGVGLWALTGQPLVAQNVGQGIEPGQASRGHQVGTRGANFLHIGPSARARALGNAGTSLIQGATVLAYNPGAAALAEGFELAGSYTDLYGGSGIHHAFLGVILPVGDAGAVGLHGIWFGSGDITATTELSPGGFDPVRGDIVSWTSVGIGLTYSHQITDRLSLGGTIKFVQEGIEFAKVQFWGGDLGTVFDTGLFGARLAASVLNLSGQSSFNGAAVQGEIIRYYRPFDDKILGSDLIFQYVTDKMEMPTTFRFGLSLPLVGRPEAVLGAGGPQHRLDFVTDVTDSFDTDIITCFGLEYAFRETLFLRGGKQFLNEEGSNRDWNDALSGGVGVHLPVGDTRGIDFDYAYTNMGILDGVHQFALQIGF